MKSPYEIRDVDNIPTRSANAAHGKNLSNGRQQRAAWSYSFMSIRFDLCHTMRSRNMKYLSADECVTRSVVVRSLCIGTTYHSPRSYTRIMNSLSTDPMWNKQPPADSKTDGLSVHVGGVMRIHSSFMDCSCHRFPFSSYEIYNTLRHPSYEKCSL